jgi:hypothetical protein
MSEIFSINKESSLGTANFHKKSYFEGYFNFLKFSDALASVN